MPRSNSGGKEAGRLGGRPPGNQIERRMHRFPEDRHEWTEEDRQLALAVRRANTETRLNTIKPEHLIVVAMRARGIPWQKISAHFGKKNHMSFYKLQTRPWWNEEMIKAVDRISREPLAAVRDAIPSAIEAQRKAIDAYVDGDKDPALALKASELLLAYGWGKPLIQSISKSDTQITVRFIDEPDNDGH